MRKIYHLLFTLFAFIVISQSSFSQTVTIGTGTSVQRQPLAYYFGYGRSSMIYTAAEMGTTAANASVISVAFFCNTAANTGPTVIYLQEVGSTTAQASVTWDAKIASATSVYSGTPAVGAVGWRTITLATPFPLTANQNLEVMVETNFTGTGTGGSAGNNITYSTVTNGHQTWQQDNSAPTGTGTVNSQRPNIQLVLGGPIVCVAPPGGGTTQGPAGAVCPGSSFALSVTGASFGTGLTYQWESSPDNTTWTPIGGATNSALTTTQSVTTYYRRKISCSGQDAYSVSKQIVSSAPISTLPWTENFDALGTVGPVNFPSCWNKQSGDWRSADEFSTDFDSDPRSAPNCIQTAWSATNDLVWTPGFQLTAGTSYDFSFWFADFDGSNSWTVDLLYNTAPNSAGATQLGTSILASGTTAPTTYTLGKRTFVPAVSGVYFFGIRVNEPTGNPWFLSFDDFRFELTPPCTTPTGLSVSGIAPTSATLNWIASTSAPADGYEWEVRTSGAGGSGPTGLAASGTTAAGIVTANAAGLTVNTNYNLYVRSACTAGTLYSTWAGPVAFQTPCNAITVFPFTETFEAASPSVSCWRTSIVSGSVNWTYGAGAGNGGSVTTAHGGTVNARHFGNGSGSVAKLISPALNLSTMPPALGAQLSFWYANQDWAGDQNELRVYYKTSAAGAWTLIPGAIYNANVGVWTQVELLLPSSTGSDYYIAFEGTELFGRGVAIDDVVVSAAPSCPKPTNVAALSPLPTSMVVSFTSPGTSFIVEYGPVGFAPGTGGTAGAGTIVTGAASPITIPGLTANTTYDFYLRRECTAGADYSANVLVKATTLCAPTNVPYTQDFTGVVLPNIPSCTSLQDLNGAPSWQTETPPTAWGFPGNALVYNYDPAKPANDWFYIQGLNLTAGTTYELDYKYGTTDPLYPESMKVALGTSATASAMTTVLKDYPSIVANAAAPFAKLERLSFTVPATGVYYIGFQAYSAADEFRLILDSIKVKVLPTVDVGVTALSATPTCPTNLALQATIFNYNLNTLNFATNPVTVTATFTGGPISTTINTGTLAPGTPLTVQLPSYNYTAASYNMTVATSSPDDPETANNSLVKVFVVNPSPAVAVITPAAPQICAGAVVQLSTQFTGTGNPKVTWSPITGLFVNAAANMIYTAGTDALTVWAKPAGTTTYTVTTTNVATGCTSTSTVTVTVNSNTSINISTVLPARICVSDPSLPLNATPIGGNWTGVGVSGSSFVPGRTAPGTFTLTYNYTNATSCTTTASIVAKVEDCPERVRLLRDNAVILYPNPSNGKFSIRMNSTLYTNLIMKVYTGSGNQVLTQSLTGLTYGRVVDFDLTSLPGGTYMVQFSYDGGVRSSEKTFVVVIGR